MHIPRVIENDPAARNSILLYICICTQCNHVTHPVGTPGELEPMHVHQTIKPMSDIMLLSCVCSTPPPIPPPTYYMYTCFLFFVVVLLVNNIDLGP